MEIDNPDGKLLPNLTAYVDIVTNEMKDVLIVPDKSILRSNGKDYVFVVDENDIMQQREVQIGATDYENTEILSGVQEGERVVSKGMPTQLFDAEKNKKNGKAEVKDGEIEPKPTETK